MSFDHDSSNLLPHQGEAYLLNGFLDLHQSACHFEQLKTEIQWRQEPIWMFGKQVMQPRLTAWYGDHGRSYRYSGIEMQPSPWTDALLPLKHRIESRLHVDFNSVLLNFYRDGQDSMGWHRDNEPELGPNPTIASLSLGERRRFLMRKYEDHSLVQEIWLEPGSLLVMQGECQRFWEHSIPKSTKIKQPRINLTFRKIV